MTVELKHLLQTTITHFFIYSCAFPTIPCHNYFCDKGHEGSLVQRNVGQASGFFSPTGLSFRLLSVFVSNLAKLQKVNCEKSSASSDLTGD